MSDPDANLRAAEIMAQVLAEYRMDDLIGGIACIPIHAQTSL